MEIWQWLLGAFNAFTIGLAKTGVPGAGTLISPLMVLTVGDARLAAAWTVPMLSAGDVFAVIYWRRHADVKKLFSLIPWVAVGMVVGGAALSLDEHLLRRIVGGIIVLLLALYIAQRSGLLTNISRGAAFFGITAGFASTVANAAGPIMSMYLLSRRLSKEQFVATGAWFFLVVNLAKVPIYVAYGLFSRESLIFDAAMIPLVICGGLTGLWLIHRIPQKIFDSLIVALTATSLIFLFR